MFCNQFGEFIDLDPDPYSSNFVDPDPHHWFNLLSFLSRVFCKSIFPESCNFFISLDVSQDSAVSESTTTTVAGDEDEDDELLILRSESSEYVIYWYLVDKYI